MAWQPQNLTFPDIIRNIFFNLEKLHFKILKLHFLWQFSIFQSSQVKKSTACSAGKKLNKYNNLHRARLEIFCGCLQLVRVHIYNTKIQKYNKNTKIKCTSPLCIDLEIFCGCLEVARVHSIHAHCRARWEFQITRCLWKLHKEGGNPNWTLTEHQFWFEQNVFFCTS